MNILGAFFLGMNNYFFILLFLMMTNFNFVKCDAPEEWQLGFQDPATPMMEGIINLHHDLMFFMVVMSIFVTWMLASTLWHFEKSYNSVPSTLMHGTFMEIVWTVTPAIILLMMAIPSFSLLYAMDEVMSPAITMKTLGHQWYWSDEY